MNLFKNFNISTKLSLGFGLLLTLMLALSAFSFLRMQSVSTAFGDEIALFEKKMQPLYVTREALAQTGLAARNAFIFSKEDDTKRELDLLDQQKALYLDALKSLTPLYQGDADFEAMSRGLLQMAEELKRPRQYRNAGQMKEYGEFLVNECSPLRRQIVSNIDKVIRSAQDEMKTGGINVTEMLKEAVVWILIVSSVALALGIYLAVMLTRGITKPIAEAVAFAKKITTGDLTGTISASSNDEIGNLVASLKDMNSNLAGIVEQVRSGTYTIATASSQIAAGNLDLSSRTEEQASSLEETASSMEELTSTVKQNADNARQANSLAMTASEVARKGGVVVAEVVGTMSAINDSSRKIVEIIAVIDGIAFQTNILALNAAVEAARAGEQGRGFAVVASEVRNLAQRSAAAAKEIKTLIGDSVEKVEVGAKLVDQAGTTMNEIVESVKHVTDIMGEITAASQEQTAGIEQINTAITQMDEVTQQNAALVEEAAAAAESLQDQAANLLQVVSVFKTGDSQALQLAPVPASTPRAKEKAALAQRVKKPLLASGAASGSVGSRGANSISSASSTATNTGRAIAKPIPVRSVAPVTTNGGGDWEEF